MPTCSQCKVDKEPGYFSDPRTDPGHRCRVCKVRGYEHKLKKEGAELSDIGLLAATDRRRSYVVRTLAKRACIQCQHPSTDFYVKTTGLLGQHWTLCEHYASPWFISRYVSQLAALCTPCSLGEWSVDVKGSKEQSRSVKQCKRIAAYWRRRAQAGGGQAAAYWRATYYWDARTRQATIHEELLQARAVHEVPLTALPIPWFADPLDSSIEGELDDSTNRESK